MSVQRWDLSERILGRLEWSDCMASSPDGDWVDYADHAAELTRTVHEKDAEIARLRTALEWYAAEVNWCPQSMAWNAASGTTLGQSNVQDDLGQRARKALEGNDAQ